MSVQAVMTNRPAREPRGSGFYLMELRRHFAETSGRRRRIPVGSWSVPKVHVVPILNRPHRFGAS